METSRRSGYRHIKRTYYQKFEKTYRIINLQGAGDWRIASLLHSVPLHRDLGEERGSLHCFTPFRFIAIWGREGIAPLLHFVPLHRDLGERNRSIASLRSALSQFGGGEGNRSIASLRSASLRFGEGNRSIASLRSALSRFGGGEGNRSIASLRSASSRFGGGEGVLTGTSKWKPANETSK